MALFRTASGANQHGARSMGRTDGHVTSSLRIPVRGVYPPEQFQHHRKQSGYKPARLDPLRAAAKDAWKPIANQRVPVRRTL